MHDSISSSVLPSGHPDHAWWEYDELRRHCVEMGAGDRSLWQDTLIEAPPAGADDTVRTDECLRAEIFDWLVLHGGLDAASIEIHVSDGHVTLRGVVRDRFRSRAEDLVACVPGVICLQSQLAPQES
jgi:osmotically-inducible protein OsmY